ncbi:hypothetical protein MMRN_p0340 (plasmid) [Mycobacterium marinum]|nr:hypothetical protein MMRN_p0340 [Mycobacterium marinum]
MGRAASGAGWGWATASAVTVVGANPAGEVPGYGGPGDDFGATTVVASPATMAPSAAVVGGKPGE